MFSNSTTYLKQGKVARIAGGCYLAYILATVLADILAHIGRGDAQQIYQVIAINVLSFRLALVVAFVSALLFLVTAWALYVLLQPVNKNVALLFLLLNTVGVGIQCTSMLPLVFALLMGNGTGSLSGFSAAQVQDLVYLSINTYRTGFVTAQLFFGAWLFPLGYLVYKYAALPRFLGVLLLLDGVAVMVWFMQALILPDYALISKPGLLVSLVAEVGLAVWLLVKGVKDINTSAVLRTKPGHSM